MGEGFAPPLFRLYVAGDSPNSLLALRNLHALCEQLYGEKYRLEVIDVLLSPERAWADGVIATPTTLKLTPAPKAQIIGNLSNTEQVLGVLNFSAERHD